MRVFDFSNVSNTEKEAECTYTTFQSNEPEATSEMPILILDNREAEMAASFLWLFHQSKSKDFL